MLFYFVDWFSALIVPIIAVLIVFGAIKKAPIRKLVLMSLLTIYLSAMLDIVGICDISFWACNPNISFVPFSDLIEYGFSFQIVFQYIANIIMLIPFGFLLPLIWKSFRKLPSTAIAGAAVSIFIELNQMLSFRLSAVDDLIMNTLGAVVGYLIVACFARKSWKSGTISCSKSDLLELLVLIAVVYISAIFIKYPIAKLIYSLPMFAR